MRNVVPLVGIGCVTVILLGVIVGGIVMIGYGVGDVFKKDETKQAAPPPVPNAQPGLPSVPKETQDLSEARSSFKTTRVDSTYQRNGNDLPVVPQAQTIFYKSAGNNLTALFVTTPKKGPRQPLVIWVHDGFGGITSADWEKAKPFRDAGCAVMIPAFREENANEGEFEMFYGEVDDLFAAIEKGASQPGVDANRVYVVGQGTGGTLALLAAVSGKQKPAVRAYFAMGGIPYLEEFLQTPLGSKIANVTPPFIPRIPNEARLRSALPFAASIQQPTFFFGDSNADPLACGQATRMEEVANANRKQPLFRAFPIANQNRDNFIAPLVKIISEKIERDQPGPPTFRFDSADFKPLIQK
jgi:pimeloyl-ACP methyl ester carboxylesterase